MRCFPITVYAFDTFDLPGWIYLTAFILCLVVFWNVVGERVPLYLSNLKTWTALDDLIAGKDALSFIDIGSGMGGTINYLGKHNPEGHFKGIENAKDCMGVTVELKQDLYTLLVDSIGDVMALENKDLEKNPITLDPKWREFASGIYRLEDNLMVVLDVERLLDIQS